jgi:hypothetical protein
MASLDLRIDEKGVRLHAGSGSVSGTSEVARLVAAISLPLNLLNEAVQDYYTEAPTSPDAPVEPLEIDSDTGLPKLDLPTVFMPSLVDGMLDIPRRITIQTANGPRDPFDDPPQWFVDGVRKMFPKEDFNLPVNRELIERMEAQYQAGTNEFGEQVPGFKYVEDSKDLTGETAVMLFQSALDGFNEGLDHWGFVEGKDGEDVLVSEPYGIDLAGVSKLAKLIKKADWTFRIVGRSAHFPSATIRIEIQPKGLENSLNKGNEGTSHAA